MKVLNEQQQIAVTSTEGPILILAGAGSGKTTVLIERIAHLISPTNSNYPSSASNRRSPVSPSKISVITFTSKAAQEIRKRLTEKLGATLAEQIKASTFHSMCLHILRNEPDLLSQLGYTPHFSISDTKEQLEILESVYKENEISSAYNPKAKILSLISDLKSQLVMPEDLLREIGTPKTNADRQMEGIAKIYQKYQKHLIANNMMDFDDLQCYTLKLLRNNPRFQKQICEQHDYLMIDEYQDTSRIQAELAYAICPQTRNICVVGDDDQSIYGFRGADAHIIQEFQTQYPDANRIYLTQNYRSTPSILNAANHVINNNLIRIPKELWTEHDTGTPIRYKMFSDPYKEAEAIANIIKNGHLKGIPYNRFAVLYRLNICSGPYEEVFQKYGIPYSVKRPMKCYLSQNYRTVIDCLSAIINPALIPYKFNSVKAIYPEIKLPRFHKDLEKNRSLKYGETDTGLTDQNFLEIHNKIIAARGQELILIFDQFAHKVLGNIETKLDGLRTSLKRYTDREGEAATFENWIADLSLEEPDVSPMDQDSVSLMTIHSAKGLEFDYVFLVEFNSGIFPHIDRDTSNIEEERRLFYVAITRAKKYLAITSSQKIPYSLRSKNQSKCTVSSFYSEVQPFIQHK